MAYCEELVIQLKPSVHTVCTNCGRWKHSSSIASF